MTLFTGTAPTFAAGDNATVVANLNILRDVAKALTEAWTAYVPVLGSSSGSPAIGNGTLSGRWWEANKKIEGWAKLLAGTTTNYGTGTVSLTLPTAPHATHPCNFNVFITDASSGNRYLGRTFGISGSTVFLGVDNSTAGGTLAGLSATVPITFATGDVITVEFSYEAA